MSLSEAIEEALDHVNKEGLAAGKKGEQIRIESGDKQAEVQVIDIDRLGVKVDQIRISQADAIDVASCAEALTAGMGCIAQSLQPIEVDSKLGHAILRTDPQQIRQRRFFEVGVQASGEVDMKRFAVDNDGERHRVDWTMTHDQLGRLLDELTEK